MVDLLDTSCWFDSMRFSLWNCSLYTSYHRLQYPFINSFWWSIWVLQGWIKASSQIIIGLNETKRTSQPRDDIRLIPLLERIWHPLKGNCCGEIPLSTRAGWPPSVRYLQEWVLIFNYFPFMYHCQNQTKLNK